MGYHNTENGKKKGYVFDKLPENIRQMGEQPEKERIYIEDYVVTYMHHIFQKKQEKAVVILVGKKGEGRASDVSFVYGALEIELDILEEAQRFNVETWNKVYELIGQHFQGAQVLGWGCGVSMWNSRIDNVIQQIQKKHFKEEGKIFFLEDLSEKEEKIFKWESGTLKELPGYVIYYEKNPQMQEFMLLGKPKKSFESTYQDKVTSNVRHVIQQKEEKPEPKKLVAYTAGVSLLLLTVLGANLLIQSTRKIDNLEKTIETLSNAATSVTEKPVQKKANPKKSNKNKKLNKSSEAENTSIDVVENKKETPKPTKSSVQGDLTTREPSKNTLVTEALKNTATPKALEDIVTPQPVKEQVQNENTPVSENPVEKTQVEQTVNQSNASYIVRAGDTLSQIVLRQYNTLSCLEMVKKANNIEDGDKIKEGQKIILPVYQE